MPQKLIHVSNHFLIQYLVIPTREKQKPAEARGREKAKRGGDVPINFMILHLRPLLPLGMDENPNLQCWKVIK